MWGEETIMAVAGMMTYKMCLCDAQVSTTISPPHPQPLTAFNLPRLKGVPPFFGVEIQKGCSLDYLDGFGHFLFWFWGGREKFSGPRPVGKTRVNSNFGLSSWLWFSSETPINDFKRQWKVVNQTTSKKWLKLAKEKKRFLGKCHSQSNVSNYLKSNFIICGGVERKEVRLLNI